MLELVNRVAFQNILAQCNFVDLRPNLSISCIVHVDNLTLYWGSFEHSTFFASVTSDFTTPSFSVSKPSPTVDNNEAILEDEIISTTRGGFQWFLVHQKGHHNLKILGFVRMTCVASLLIFRIDIFMPTLQRWVFLSQWEMIESSRLNLGRIIRIIVKILSQNHSLLWFPVLIWKEN